MRFKTDEWLPLLVGLGLLAVVMFLVVGGGYLPGSITWTTVNDDLISSLPFLICIGVGLFVMTYSDHVYVIAGSGITGIGFALLLDALDTGGVIDPSKFTRFGGSINTLAAASVVAWLLIGLMIAMKKRQ